MAWQVYNPYKEQMILYVANAEKGALGQFFRDFGDDLEGFAGGEDIDMRGVSVTGQGPPLGWILASYVTPPQGDAFLTHPELPATVEVDVWPIGEDSPHAWLAEHTPPLIIIEEE